MDSASSIASSPDTSPVLRTVELEKEAAGQLAEAETEAEAAEEAAVGSSASLSRRVCSPSPSADVPAPEAAIAAPFSPFGEGAAAVAPTCASSVWQPERSQSSEEDASTELASEQVEQVKADVAAPPLEPPEPANDAAQQQPSSIAAADEVQPAVEDQVVRSLRITLAERAAPRKQRAGVVGSSPSLLKRASERGTFSPRKRADIKAKAQRASPIKVHFTPGPVA